MRVIDLMTTDVVTVATSAPLREAARIMVNQGVSGLPVTDESGKLIGIITEADFLRKELEREHTNRPGLLHALFDEEISLAEAETVGEVMTESVVTIGYEATLAEAARVMTAEGVKRLPIVDAEGHLKGVISRADIVEAFTRPDDVIEDELREDVVRRLLFLDPGTLDIAVTEGVVHLGGELPSRSDARLLEEMTRRLDGVIRVDSTLTWAVDDTKMDSEPQAPLP